MLNLFADDTKTEKENRKSEYLQMYVTRSEEPKLIWVYHNCLNDHLLSI